MFQINKTVAKDSTTVAKVSQTETQLKQILDYIKKSAKAKTNNSNSSYKSAALQPK